MAGIIEVDGDDADCSVAPEASLGGAWPREDAESLPFFVEAWPCDAVAFFGGCELGRTGFTK